MAGHKRLYRVEEEYTCPRCGACPSFRIDSRFAALLGFICDTLGIDGNERVLTHRCGCGTVYQIPIAALARDDDDLDTDA